MVSYITLSAARLQRFLLLKTTTDIKKKRTLVLLCVKLKVQDFFGILLKNLCTKHLSVRPSTLTKCPTRVLNLSLLSSFFMKEPVIYYLDQRN